MSEKGGLERFKKAKEHEIESLISLGEESLRARVKVSRPDFLKALKTGKNLRGLAVIAEYKRASPSLGEIHLGLSPEEVLKSYVNADAISVLTEEKYFQGSLEFLSRMDSKIPLLRKDFISHPFQVLETAGTCAAAILFIVRLTPDPQFLQRLITLADSCGLASVVEVFEKQELHIAREAQAKIIQVNARDLETLKLDLNSSLRFIEDNLPLEHEFWISASGIQNGSDLKRIRASGYGGALVGTALMKDGNPQAALLKMLNEL
ncbi:MAG: indole-3-glycerol-phosphate synthase [Deltaproteobacteria bacterium]|jgi:indole-3-glycerol phosphate synthase|nr:indole-3-glycerol-phosphate synthase [Deltaproteobacteria bacterium]